MLYVTIASKYLNTFSEKTKNILNEILSQSFSNTDAIYLIICANISAARKVLFEMTDATLYIPLVLFSTKKKLNYCKN